MVEIFLEAVVFEQQG
jgi:hypothetical protein